MRSPDAHLRQILRIILFSLDNYVYQKNECKQLATEVASFIVVTKK